MNTFVIRYEDGREILIHAARFNVWGDSYRFYRSKGGEDMKYDAIIESHDVVSIVPQDMLVSSFEGTSVLPEIVAPAGADTDYATETLFSEAEKIPFSQSEREAIVAALQTGAEQICQTFDTTPEQQSEITRKIEYLSRKVRELDKFNWKRLLITILVGISVDLGFGTLIPSALLTIFKDVFSHLIGRLASRRSSLSDSH